MYYCDPTKVDSPKRRWTCANILINTGQGGWSAAEGVFDDRDVVVLRWNGSDADEQTGNPQSRGHPTWFVVPDALADAVRRGIAQTAKSIGLVTCNITQPTDYQNGAYKIEAILEEQNIKKLSGRGLSFAMPDLPNRLCRPDDGYFCAGQNGFRGQFVDGKWLGHVYSNGCSEEDNPTTIDAFKDALIQNIVQAVNHI